MLYFGHLVDDPSKSGWFPYFYVQLHDEKPQKKDSDQDIVDCIKSSNIPADRREALLKRRMQRKQRMASRIGSDVPSKDKASKKKEKERPTLLKTGHLGKYSYSNGVFKQRWFVLRPQGLTFFVSPADKKPVGKLATKNIKSVFVEEKLSAEKKLFVFTVTTKKKSDALCLACKDEQDRAQWMNVLGLATQGGGAIQSIQEKKSLSGSSDSVRIRSEPKPQPVSIAKPTLSTEHLKPNNVPTIDKPIQKPFDTPPPIQETPRGPRLTPRDRPVLGHLKNQDFSASTLFSKVLGNPTENIVLENVTMPRPRGLARVRALRDYLPSAESLLVFHKNDEWILLNQKNDNGWWLGLFEEREGYFPSTYVKVIETYTTVPKTPEPKRKEQAKEKEKRRELLENFQIGERIGKGAFGSVFRGINVENGKWLLSSKLVYLK